MPCFILRGMANNVFPEALATILREIFDGTLKRSGFLLNSGDPGLLAQLEQLDPAVVSTRPMPGRTTVVQHVAHVLYGLELLNRWMAGEENPWASADWEAAWKLGTVDESQWKDLLAKLREEAKQWQLAISAKTGDWDQMSACGAIASAAHTAYHMGAIRQILAAANAYTPA